jgi:hypothetical protein
MEGLALFLPKNRAGVMQPVEQRIVREIGIHGSPCVPYQRCSDWGVVPHLGVFIWQTYEKIVLPNKEM